MPETFIEPLRELEVARLLKFIRQEEDKAHIADFCAYLCSEFSRIARHVGKVGFVLSDEWKSADHLVLGIDEYKTRLFTIHVRAAADKEEQSIAISCAALKRRERVPHSFSLPAQFTDAKNYIMGQLFTAFPEGTLIVMKTAKEQIPMFQEPVITLPPTWDEAVMKERAAANEGGSGKNIRTPYASDNVRVRSFSRN